MSAPLRIFVVCWANPCEYPHGIERAAWGYSRELAKKNCEVHVCYNYDVQPVGPLEQTVEGILLHGVSTKKRDPFSRRIVFYRECLKMLKTLELEHRFDLVSLYGPVTIPLIAFFRRRSTRVVIQTPTAVIYEFLMYLKEITHIPRKSVGILLHYLEMTVYETTLLRFADAILVPTARNVEEFRRCYLAIPEKKFRVVPYGQDIHREFYGHVRDRVDGYRERFNSRHIILFIGANWRRKGLRSLLYAYKRVIEHTPCVLVIASPPQEPYVALMKKLGFHIGEDIIITGHVSNEELALLYASCDVFVLPSHHEALSQTVIEAMAFGKPVVASPIAAYPVIEDGVDGFIVDPANTEAIAQRLNTLLTDATLYTRMSEKAIKKSQEYTWEACAQKMYEEYTRICHE